MEKRRVALVTGSGSPRVGAVIAKELGQRGYDLVLHYRQSQGEAIRQVETYSAQGINAIAIQANLSDPAEVATLFHHVQDKFGRLDVLVNSAAIWNPSPLETTSAADVRSHFEANTLGTFLCCQQGGLIMTHQPEGGCIVNLGDWADIRPYRNYAAYFPSKGAIPALTRSMAVELGTRNPRVRVNCILPGPVMLPDSVSPFEKQQIIAGTLVKREGTPQNIAQGVCFLVENDFVTGVSLPIDGGRSIYAREGEDAVV